MKRALIIGCGYTGLRLAGRLQALGYTTVGTTRGGSRTALLEESGVVPLVAELENPETLDGIRRLKPRVVFYFVPPLDPYEDPLVAIMKAAATTVLEAFVYASSTSVYGDRGGNWVDETDDPAPQGARAEARHRAEQEVVSAALRDGLPTRVCRITGIYGPGRTLHEVLERGDYALIRGRDSWINRIHVDDLLGGLLASWGRGTDGRIYNMADDEPHLASEFALLAAELHGLSAPQWIEPVEAIRRYGQDRLRRKMGSKRVSNRRLREELGYELTYPSYKTGLPAAVREEQGEA